MLSKAISYAVYAIDKNEHIVCYFLIFRGYSLVKLRDMLRDSQNIADGKFESDSDEEDDNVDNNVNNFEQNGSSFRNSRKRQVSSDDSPPRRATKRKA